MGRVATQGLLAKAVYYLWKPMMWSIQKAAATSIFLATSDEVEGVTGRFYGNCKEKRLIINLFLKTMNEKCGVIV